MKWIDRCLQSLQQSYLPIQTIVIDNGSTDGLRQYVPAHYPDIVWLPQEQNLGFGQANNIGLRYALDNNADYALLLNQDAWINAEMLVQLLRFDDRQCILSPIHLNGQGSDFDFNFKKNTISRSSNICNLRELKSGDKLKPFEARAAAAACWLIPSTIIQKVGGFNPLFFQYGEDHNYLDRAFYHGFHLKVVPTTFACHDRNQYGNSQLYHKCLVYRYLLIKATDINEQPTFGQYLHICGFWCKKGLHNRKLFKMIGQSISGLIRLRRNRKAIKESRAAEQAVGPTWLEGLTIDY